MDVLRCRDTEMDGDDLRMVLGAKIYYPVWGLNPT